MLVLDHDIPRFVPRLTTVLQTQTGLATALDS